MILNGEQFMAVIHLVLQDNNYRQNDFSVEFAAVCPSTTKSVPDNPTQKVP